MTKAQDKRFTINDLPKSERPRERLQKHGAEALSSKGLNSGIGFGSTEFHVLRPCKNVTSKHLYYLTYSHKFRHMGGAMIQGAAGQKRVPERFVKNFTIGIPPKKKQFQIADYSDQKTSKIDELIKKIESQIENLKEHRQTLISNVVTGKVRISN